MENLYYKKNDANAICDVCGQKFKLSQLRKRWDGLWVCKQDFEYRHPQEYIKARHEQFTLPVIKPRPPDVFIPFNYTKEIVDALSLTDDITTVVDYTIYIPLQPVPSRDFGSINGIGVNSGVINSGTLLTPTPPATEEYFTTDDTISISFQVTFTETVSFSETLNINPDILLSDATTITDSLVIRISKGGAVNGSPVNGSVL